MSENTAELKAKLYTALLETGHTVRMNYRYNLQNKQRGYRVVVLDIAIIGKAGAPIFVFYVGRKKPRKTAKYRMVGLSTFFVTSEESIPLKIREFTESYIKRYLS